MTRIAHGEKGAALIIAMMIVMMLAALAAVVVQDTSTRETMLGARERDAAAFELAESALDYAFMELRQGRSGTLGASSWTPSGTGDVPRFSELNTSELDALPRLGPGRYFTYYEATGPGGVPRIIAGGQVGPPGRTVERYIEASLTAGQPHSLYYHSIYAGNSSNDPTYTMPFGGKSSSADVVKGDVYSGGNVLVQDDAKITGTIEAKGTITGASGNTGVSIPPPDMAGMDYEHNHDVGVATQFAPGGPAKYQTSNQPGKAWEITDSANPAHIFRMNPEDRAEERAQLGNGKNDFFLEDPTFNGKSDPNHIVLTNSDQSAQTVYYVDGNLWVHHKDYYGFKVFANQRDSQDSLKGVGPGGNKVNVTFVVKGNIFFSDNILLRNKNKDGLAFIAIKDPAVANSGNIYIGDPRYGTVEELNCFLYAENNFYDVNLTAAGSQSFEINGNMTAGNKVSIQRDYQKSGKWYHSKMTVTLDDRLKNGTLSLPGLPQVASGGVPSKFIAWRELDM